MRPKHAVKVLSTLIKNGKSVLLKGAPGVGKSDIVAQVCEELGYELIISHPVVSDPTDFKGLPYAANGSAEFLPFGDLRKIMEATEPTVYFLDDLGQAAPSVQAACMQLLLARQINGKKISDKVTFIAATNRKEDKAAVSGILEPVKSRFSTIIELTPNLDDWVSWAMTHNIPTCLISFLRWRPNLLNDFKATKDITNSPCPRTVAQLGGLYHDMVSYINNKNTGESTAILHEVFSGAVGEGFAAEFMGFLKVYKRLPDVDAMLQRPQQAHIPGEPDVLHALIGVLVKKTNKQTVEAVYTIASRDEMPPEFATLLVKDMITAYPEAMSSQAYVRWITKNKDLLVGC